MQGNKSRGRRAGMDLSVCPAVDATARQDPQQVEALITAYAPLVKYLAHRLACRLPASIGLDDLISAGVLGLLDAIKKYDPRAPEHVQDLCRIPDSGGHARLCAGVGLGAPVRARERARPDAGLCRDRTRAGASCDRRGSRCLAGPRSRHLGPLADRGPRGLRPEPGEAAGAGRRGARPSPSSRSWRRRLPVPANARRPRSSKQHLAAAIDALPQQEKVVLSLYYFEELTMREIGQVLEVTESRISQIRYAKPCSICVPRCRT